MDDDGVFTPNPDYQELQTRKGEMIHLKARFDELTEHPVEVNVEAGDLAHVIEIWTGIPANKIEETEYTGTALKARCTYEYDANDRVVREVVYDERNKPYRIHKIEYNADGTKKRQLNYNTKGVLLSVREYEYIRGN